MPSAVIPDPALVVLVGPSGSGKSTWAAARYRPAEIVSSDQLRGIVGSGENDLDASADAFALLDQIVAARLGRGLTTVVDTLGFDPQRRRAQLDLARRAGLPGVAVLFGAEQARSRNRLRDRPVPAAVLSAQLRRMPEAASQLAGEGWTLVEPAEDLAVEPSHSAGSQRAAESQRDSPARLRFMLQLSRFPWGQDPAAWLAGIASAAAGAGLAGIALMDHLIQIPQVGRPFEPIPEPWVTLGLLAGLTASQAPDLEFGTLVTPATFRAPGILAKTVATLNALTGGRAFCGLGAGWWDREHAAFGLPFPPPGERLDSLELTIETMRALWAPGTKAHAGRRVRLPETTCYPRPAGPVKIIVGGQGDRTLRIAASAADGCNLPADAGLLERKLPVLRAACEQSGRDPAEVAVTVLDLPVIGRDRDETAALVERLRGRTSATAYARAHHAGTAADHIGRYRLLAERGVSTVFVALPDLASPADLLKLAPVTAAFSS